MTSASRDKLGRLFLRPFRRLGNVFDDEFQRQNFFKENVGAICTISFKIREKIVIKEHSSDSSERLTSQTSLLLSRSMCDGSAFQFGFLINRELRYKVVLTP